MSRLAVLFIPSAIGILWKEIPEFSLAWSLAGSVFIAVISQTVWFRKAGNTLAFRYYPLRPLTMFQVFFVGYHVIGAGFHALDAAGYTFWGRIEYPLTSDLPLIAEAQSLMLLGQASVTAGMMLAGLDYQQPRYIVSGMKPNTLIVYSFACLIIATGMEMEPTLRHFASKILAISLGAILVEVALLVGRRQYRSLRLALPLLGLNVVQQVLSGWKSIALWTMLTLGALLYPFMPRRIVVGAIAGFVFWAFVLYPFGMAYRPLAWNEGVEKQEAALISVEHAVNMPLSERLDVVWTMMSRRANDVYQFRKYIEYVPSSRPYFGLELLQESVLGLVPRALWPEKPDLEVIAMQRVYDAEIVSEDVSVSAKSNYFQDAYLSGGWPVVVVASLFLGLVAILINRSCEQLFGGYYIGTCLIYTSLFASTINLPPNFIFFLGTLCASGLVTLALFGIGRISGRIIETSSSVGERSYIGLGYRL